MVFEKPCIPVKYLPFDRYGVVAAIDDLCPVALTVAEERIGATNASSS